MKYLLWLFIPILLLGQVKTVTQTGVKRSMIRGDATTLTWTVSGDYSSDSLLFIAMDNDSNAVLRLTTSGGLTASYSSPNTTITGTIHAATTENFIAQNYLYDISSVTDSVTLIMGLLSVIADVSNLEDTVLASVPYYTVALDTPAANNNFIVGMDSTNRWYQKTLAQTRTILGIDTITGAANLPDSVVYDSQISDMVTKSTSQTITGQKNFMGLVKIGSDTSISLGMLGSDGIRTGLQINTTASHPFGFNRIFQVNPYNIYSGDWSLTTGETDFLADTLGVDHTIVLSSNRSGDLQLPQFGFQLENNYEFSDSGKACEYFLFYNNRPSPNTTYSVRPMQLGIEEYTSGRHVTSITMSLNRFFIGGTNYLDDRFDFQPMYEGFAGKLGAFFLNDSSWMCNNVNNFGWLYQLNATNNSVKELMRLDNLNNVVISPDGGTHIDLRAPIWGSIKWDDKDSTGTIPIYRETGTNRIYVGGTDGMVTNSIEVKSVPTDTTGLGIGQIYLGEDGSLNYTAPANIQPNGDFTNWSGIGKYRIPDNFYIYDDTLHTYVEENPTGQLHVVNDGTASWSILSYDSSEAGKTYGYSFTVTQISDTVRFYIVDESAYLLSSTGVYTGVSDEVTSARNFVGVFGSDDGSSSEITLDNIRIWDLSSTAKQAPVYIHNLPYVNNFLNPTTDDTLSLFLTDKALQIDSIKFRVDDSIGVKLTYGALGLGTTILESDTLVSGWQTITSFDDVTVEADNEVYLYFTYIGDTATFIRWKIYWREQ